MKNDNTRDTFVKTGDYADNVLNVSGAHWDGALSTLRPRTITPPGPGQHVTPRTQRMISATSGERLDSDLEKSLSAAARRRLQFGEAVDQSHPSARPMLEHLFGLNLPGRDRA